MRTYFFLAVLIIIAVFALWFQEDIKQQPPLLEQADEHFPDYFMENFSITGLNEQGVTSYTIQASRMLHYADDNSAELENPVLEFSDAGRQFTIRAGRADYLQQDNLVHLYDDVTIIRQDSGNQGGELSIHTSYLKVDTHAQMAETDQPTRVSTQHMKLSANGLIYDNKQGRLKLTSQVKGTYETAP